MAHFETSTSRVMDRDVAAPRRTKTLASWLAKLIPSGSRVLDLRCSDGALGRRVMNARPSVKIEGVEVDLAHEPAIEVTPFDGQNLPFEAGTFDVVTIIDVLHRTIDPESVLVEATRVLKPGGRLLVKDCYADSSSAWSVLSLLDWAGGKSSGRSEPHYYLSRRQWRSLFEKIGLQVSASEERLGLYPRLTRWLVETDLHFLATLLPLEKAAIHASVEPASKASRRAA